MHLCSGGSREHALVLTMVPVIKRVKFRSSSAEDILKEVREPSPPLTRGRFTITPSRESPVESDSGLSTEDHQVMDRSTQVNFPIVLNSTVEHWKRAIRRHQMVESSGSKNGSPINTWGHSRSPRPKSLNNAAEIFQRSKLAFHSDNNLSMPRIPANSCNDFFSVTFKDKTSAQSTITSTGAMLLGRSQKQSSSSGEVFLPVHQRTPADATTNTTSVTCRCHCEETGRKSKLGSSSTPEGLSWRRLHMSRAKLKATATTSELLSGFAMVAMVELQINEPTSVPEWLFVMFAVCTTVLVAVHIFALMISTYILPNIDAISKLEISELITESPHERMRGFIELAWAFSTILGLFLFLVEVAILCWVKFWDYSFTAAIAATVIVIPVLIIFVLFAMHFYHSLVVHRCDTSVTDMETLENMKKQLDEVTTSPV